MRILPLTKHDRKRYECKTEIRKSLSLRSETAEKWIIKYMTIT